MDSFFCTYDEIERYSQKMVEKMGNEGNPQAIIPGKLVKLKILKFSKDNRLKLGKKDK